MRRRGMNLRKHLLSYILPVLRQFPPHIASRSLSIIGRFEYNALPEVHAQFDAAVRAAAKHFGADWDITNVARELSGNHIRWRTRDRLLDGLPDKLVMPLFQVTGRDRLDEALAKGRGVILLGNHYGANLMPAHWLARVGYPFRLFMERPRHVSRFLERVFDQDGPLPQNKLFISRKADKAESAASIVRAARGLRQGMILKLACDVRWSGPHTAPAVFMGKSNTFSTTWLALAALTQSPVISVFCDMAEDGNYHLEFTEPFTVPDQKNTPEFVNRWVAHALAIIEDRIKARPTNSNDYFFWENDDHQHADAPSKPTVLVKPNAPHAGPKPHIGTSPASSISNSNLSSAKS